MVIWKCKICQRIFNHKNNCIIHSSERKHSDFINQVNEKMKISPSLDLNTGEYLKVYIK